MSEPTLELQRGIHAALSASAPLAAAMGGQVRAYDRAPPGAAFPYITISEAQAIDDGDTCEASRFEIFTDLHVWSHGVGMAEAKTIAGALRTVLLGLATLVGWDVTIAQFQQARHMSDPDGLTSHSIVTFRFVLEPA